MSASQLHRLRALALLAACAVALAGCSLASRKPAATAQPASTSVPSRSSITPSPPRDIDSIPDAVPRVEMRSKNGNPPFYDALGHRYFVLGSADGYVERGVASWYGPTFHGGSTAMGEQYDMYAMTAAHKTLPLPAYARVTNLRNGRSVVVRINDRGPFVANRLIDLSYTAAAKLDMLREGTTLVEVRTITPGTAPPPELTRANESPAPTLYVQAGAFADEGNARRLLDRLHNAGLASAFVLSRPEPKKLYRVRVGPVSSVAQFDELAGQLARLGIPDARLALE